MFSAEILSKLSQANGEWDSEEWQIFNRLRQAAMAYRPETWISYMEECVRHLDEERSKQERVLLMEQQMRDLVYWQWYEERRRRLDSPQ